MLGLVALVENVLPPVPSDAAIALGAFLSHHGRTGPLAVFLVVWLSNLAGAAGVYWAARRFGRRLFTTGPGRRLLSPEALAIVEREYLRFGVAGIFLGRLLPGIRAVVPPFAGIVGLSPARALLPIAVSGGLWYAALTIAGATLGAQWSQVEAIIAQMNRTLGLVAFVGAVAIGIWLLVRTRRRRRERLWQALHGALVPTTGSDDRPMLATAHLVLELAYADPALTAEDRATVAEHLRERWGLAAPARAPRSPSPVGSRVTALRARIVERFGRDERLALVERMWTVVLVEGRLERRGERLLELAREVLDLSPADLRAVVTTLAAERDATEEHRG